MRNYFKKLTPSAQTIKNNPALQFLGHLLHDPNLFHFNRRSVSVALFWGLFIAVLPIPGQMPAAAFAAFYFRCNLPICCALAWVSNPFTTPFLVYFAYTLGRVCLQLDPIVVTWPTEYTWAWLIHELPKYWRPLLVPFLLGSVVTGIGLGGLGYASIRVLWRWHVVKNWKKRKAMRVAS